MYGKCFALKRRRQVEQDEAAETNENIRLAETMNSNLKCNTAQRYFVVVLNIPTMSSMILHVKTLFI